MSPRPGAALLALALSLSAVAALAAVPTLAPDQLKPGQKAVVRTVFEGDKIEEFDAEILGVLQTGRVSGDLILAKATSERVLRTGIAQGMSGSPVYVDGKLVGALSSGWSFSKEPIFGVTPIGEMLSVLDNGTPAEPDAGTAGPSGLEPVPHSTPGFRGFTWSDPQAPLPGPEAGAAVQPAPEPASLMPAPLPIPVACTGISPAALPTARRLLEPLGLTAVPGGRLAATAGPGDLVPGGAVAVELMRGDLQLAAIGTVTWRDGDRVLIFGHPFFQSGAVRLPLASAQITTVVASDLISFKLGSSGSPLGTATQDRRAAVAGRMGAPPRLMPVSVRLEGRGTSPRIYHFESVEDRALAPQLVALAALNSLLESGGIGANQTLRWSMTLHRAGFAPLVIDDLTTGISATTDLASGIGSPLGFLYNNPFSPLHLDSVEVRVDVEPGQDLWTLRSVELRDAAARPGGRVRVRCELERWRGDRKTVDLDLHVPEEAPEGRYTLWAGGADELNRYESTRLPGRYRPASLDEAWARIGVLRPAGQLYVTLLARAPEVTRGGRDYPELPTSALAVLSSGLSAEDQGRRGFQATLDEERRPIDGLVRGEVQLEVLVDPKAP